jgi:DNA-binding MarR family transcriptional regulator
VDSLPEEIRQFIERNIDSIDQLELLRVLGENPGQEWNAADLAREIQSSPGTTAAHLATLQGRGLVTRTVQGSDVFGRYGPQTPELEKLLSQFLQVYRERPVTMIKLAYAQARGALHTFADAFRIRKED